MKRLKELVSLCNELYNNNIKFHSFIINKDEQYYTTIDSKNYVLLRQNYAEGEIIEIDELLDLNNKKVKKANEYDITPWEIRWANLIDKYENQILEYNDEFPLLVESFNYYIGLAENAIKYINNSGEIFESNELLFLNHHRIFYPNISDDCFNPLNILFDYKVRDLCEYVKNTFFYNNEKNGIQFEELLDIINKQNYSKKLLVLFISRLLFPTYYFDLFNQIINKEIKEEKLNIIISQAGKFEKFLNYIIMNLKSIYNINFIDWIGK